MYRYTNCLSDQCGTRDEWTIRSMESEMPIQENSDDCGVYVIHTMNELTLNRKTFQFKDCHMPLLRKKIVFDIIRKSFEL